MRYDYLPSDQEWRKLSRDERISIAKRYVADADANRSQDLPSGKRSMSQRHAAELLELAEATTSPESGDSGPE